MRSFGKVEGSPRTCMLSPLLFVVALKCMKCHDVKRTYNHVLLKFTL